MRSLRIGRAIWTHEARTIRLAQHDDRATTPDHAEAGRFAPEALIGEAQLVVAEVCTGHNIIDYEARCNPPLESCCFAIDRIQRLRDLAVEAEFCHS